MQAVPSFRPLFWFRGGYATSSNFPMTFTGHQTTLKLPVTSTLTALRTLHFASPLPLLSIAGCWPLGRGRESTDSPTCGFCRDTGNHAGSREAGERVRAAEESRRGQETHTLSLLVRWQCELLRSMFYPPAGSGQSAHADARPSGTALEHAPDVRPCRKDGRPHGLVPWCRPPPKPIVAPIPPDC